MSFSLLGLVNTLSPKSRASRRVAAGVPYGPAARQRLDVYAPRVAGRYPVLAFIYGGSWNEGDRRDYAFVGRALAALGHVVAVPDYRVLPEVEYPVFLEDCALAVRWALEHAGEFGGDATRFGLVGHSAGAYNAVMLGLVPGYGLTDRVQAVAGLSGPYDFYPYDVEVTIRTFGAVADPLSTQPVHLLRQGAPPLFLASGDADTLVYPRNTTALARAAREAGVAVEEHHYAGLGHAQTLLPLGSLLRGKSTLMADLTGFLARSL